MRVMVLFPGPRFSVLDVANGWVSGLLAAGVDVMGVNFDARLTYYDTSLANTFPGWGDLDSKEQTVRAARLAAHSVRADFYDFWPDVVLVVSGFFLPGEMYASMRAHGHKIVLVCTESPYEDDAQLERGRGADVVLLNDPTHLDRFRNELPSVHYFPHCYDPTIHTAGPAIGERPHDFVFVGSGFPSRIRFLEKVDWDGIDAQLAGNWHFLDDDSPLVSMLRDGRDECIDNADAAALYRDARVSANLYRKEANLPELADGWAMGPREVELAACRSFFLREPRGEGDELFPFLPTFTEPGEFNDLLRWHLAHPDVCDVLAGRAQEAVVDRSFVNNARRLLALLN